MIDLQKTVIDGKPAVKWMQDDGTPCVIHEGSFADIRYEGVDRMIRGSINCIYDDAIALNEDGIIMMCRFEKIVSMEPIYSMGMDSVHCMEAATRSGTCYVCSDPKGELHTVCVDHAEIVGQVRSGKAVFLEQKDPL